MYTIALIRVQHLQHSGNNYSYRILKSPAPSSPSISVNPDYLTARTNLGTQEFRENKQNKLRVSHGTGMSKTV